MWPSTAGFLTKHVQDSRNSRAFGCYPKKNRDGTERPGPYQHLAEDVERCLKALRDAGQVPDPRTAQFERLKAEVTRARSGRAGGTPLAAEAAEPLVGAWSNRKRP
jgi:hypothetical protein